MKRTPPRLGKLTLTGGCCAANLSTICSPVSLEFSLSHWLKYSPLLMSSMLCAAGKPGTRESNSSFRRVLLSGILTRCAMVSTSPDS